MFQNCIAKNVGNAEYDSRDHWDASLEGNWRSALCRILICIRHYGHGGTVLLSDSHVGLSPKYSLQYSRLAESLIREGILLVQSTTSSDVIQEEFLDPGSNHFPMELY